jgi:hypothetical protein
MLNVQARKYTRNPVIYLYNICPKFYSSFGKYLAANVQKLT